MPYIKKFNNYVGGRAHYNVPLPREGTIERVSEIFFDGGLRRLLLHLLDLQLLDPHLMDMLLLLI